MRDLDFSVIVPYASLLPEALKITIEIGVAGFLLATLISIVVGTCRSRKLPMVTGAESVDALRKEMPFPFAVK